VASSEETASFLVSSDYFQPKKINLQFNIEPEVVADQQVASEPVEEVKISQDDIENSNFIS